MYVRRLLHRAHIVSSSLAGTVEVAVLMILLLGAVVAERPTTAFIVETSGEATASASSERNRRLHNLPYQHTHIYQQRPTDATTQTPTLIWTQSQQTSEGDDGYYTDDGAINLDMVNQKKELYQQERENNDETNNPNGPSALQSGLSSGGANDAPPFRQGRTTHCFLAYLIHTVIAWWLLVW